MSIKDRSIDAIYKQATRGYANDLRETITRATSDGVLTDTEKQQIGTKLVILSTALKTLGDEVSLPAETSPLFPYDYADAHGGTNIHNSLPLGFPSLVRPGFELNGLDAISENESNQGIHPNLSQALLDLATPSTIPATATELFEYLESDFSIYTKIEVSTPTTTAHNTDKLNVAGPSAADMAPPKPDLAKDKPLDPGLILPPKGGPGSGAHLHKMFSGPAFKNQPIPAQVQPTPAQVAQINREKRQKRKEKKAAADKQKHDAAAQNKIVKYSYDPGSKTTTTTSGGGTTRKHITASSTKKGHGMQMPIVFDLDGDGVQVTSLAESTVFMDAVGDGLLHRRENRGRHV